jgi:hypothetical protein
MTNTPNIRVGDRAIQCVFPTSDKIGKKIASYQADNNTDTDTQWGLVSTGRAGTDGIINGVTLAGARCITVVDVDPAGNASGPIYASAANSNPYGTWSKPANTGSAAFDVNLGTPIEDLTNNILASTAITALPIAATAKLDIARAVSLTGNSSSASVISVTGVDLEGNSITDQITLNGTATVNGVRAFSPSVDLTFSVVTPHTGDTFSCGCTDILGLPVRLDNRGAIPKGAVVFGTTVEATEPTVTVNPSDLSLNTILLNSDLDGSHAVIVNGIQCDSPLPQWLG